jgi:hypothetical protein
MRRLPKDIHREVLQRDDREHGSEPSVYAVWYGVPNADGSELLGRTERLPRPRWWRAFPVTGEYPRAIRGWTNIIEWFMQLHDGHGKTSDSCTATETEHVDRFPGA